MTGRNPQYQLNEFLQHELHHTMGAYSVAEEGFKDLQVLEIPSGIYPITASDLTDTIKLNVALRECADGGGDPRKRRHPNPPRAYEDDFKAGIGSLLDVIREFYAAADLAIDYVSAHDPYSRESEDETPMGDLKGEAALEVLGMRLGFVQDPQRRGKYASERDRDTRRTIAEASRRNKLARTRARLDRLDSVFDEGGSPPSVPASRRRTVAADLVNAHLIDKKPARHLARHAVEAMVEAHLRMHYVEHRISGSFGVRMASGSEMPYLKRQLAASRALNTFAYVVGRTSPWAFAENTQERDNVRRYYQDACDDLTPTYCAWLGQQLSMIALHRRAYAWWLAGDAPRAYKDFYKLKRNIRVATRALENKVTQPPGGRDFLEALHAVADHHTGQIYQREHAHTPALKHFRAATERLDRLNRPRADSSGDFEVMTRALRDARWRVRLLIDEGKAYYERGRIKRSLLSYTQAWKAFLELLGSESNARPNFVLVDSAIEWLDSIADDPDLNKTQLRDRYTPLVRQFQTISRVTDLRWLAADIMLRLGHVLLVLRLPGPQPYPEADGAPATTARHALAYIALAQAAHLDEHNTLVHADLLKIRRQGQDADRIAMPPQRTAPSAPAVADHWYAGSGRFEEAARIIEYLLQTWIDDGPLSDSGDNIAKKIAGDLLPAFLTHTDSSNVKLAQVYRYLMKEPVRLQEDAGAPPLIEFVCARRYSSFFPFLPRPAAFRAPGGGYFVRVYDPALEEATAKLRVSGRDRKVDFGIVIDPGPDFLDNLYRCGYSLADVDMVMATHDHADHLASLDALLALLGYRARLGDRRFSNTARLPIVGNASVVQRYAFYNAEQSRDAVRVVSFDDLAKALEDPEGESALDDVLLPPAMRLSVVGGRHRDAGGHHATGFVLRVAHSKKVAAIAFTSDTGVLPTPESAARTGFDDADVTVAHLSAVPLRQLRVLAGLRDVPEKFREGAASFQEIWERALASEPDRDSQEDPVLEADERRDEEFFFRQVQFGFHSLPATKNDLVVNPLSPLTSIREPSSQHLYLERVIELAERLRDRRAPGLIILGEFREELGTFRTQVAASINAHILSEPNVAALTADVGLRVMLVGKGGIRILCSTCDLDNDLEWDERLHGPHDVKEVCVRGEQEGVFYNCLNHDPGSQHEPMYVEFVERFDVFAA